MKARSIKKKIIEINNKHLGRILILTGARQTGKTTLAKKCFPNHTYLSIEDPVLRIEYRKLNASQWNSLYPMAILDEVQKEPILIESIKSVYDQFEKSKYILLGSSQLLLLKKVKESLAGRCFVQEIFPLTLPELLSNSWDDEIHPSLFQIIIQNNKIPNILPSFKLDVEYFKKQQAFDYYLKFGGYPALVNPDFTDEDRHEWLKTYVRTYLERDIRDLAEIKHLEPFIKVQRLTAMLTGQLINYSQLANESAITSKTAQRFIEYLNISYQTIFLQPWFNNPLKRLIKSPKIHFLDPGVQKTIIQKTGDLTGHEYESAIIAEIYKQAKNINFNGSFFHLRTFDGKEIDLLIETSEGFYAFEIKQSINITSHDAKHLKDLDTILPKPIIKAFILSNDTTIKHITENIMAIPAAYFLT